ncbi:hypothetical protein M0208_08290 [Sphingomonas sp. SUN019]|uniref:hypothetical protein n=1 Tax=Sphingomonas sp. SUN019 TaxID=2937788 RepID=UPI00216407DE|nr:hypothetical protein [Sphingomonas sp. SUN019]UVO50517.1 hypothetical protein M0208_08290 [Sphingomonas sp. SUN019]
MIDWRTDALQMEAVTLFDWCVFLPAMFVLCYRRQLTTGALAVRTIGIVCAGLWVAASIVPDDRESLIGSVTWLRYPGLALLVLAEGLALVAVLKITFSKTPDEAALRRLNVPPLIARLMLAEARFWRWLWTKLRGE